MGSTFSERGKQLVLSMPSALCKMPSPWVWVGRVKALKRSKKVLDFEGERAAREVARARYRSSEVQNAVLWKRRRGGSVVMRVPRLRKRLAMRE